VACGRNRMQAAGAAQAPAPAWPPTPQHGTAQSTGGRHSQEDAFAVALRLARLPPVLLGEGQPTNVLPPTYERVRSAFAVRSAARQPPLPALPNPVSSAASQPASLLAPDVGSSAGVHGVASCAQESRGTTGSAAAAGAAAVGVTKSAACDQAAYSSHLPCTWLAACQQEGLPTAAQRAAAALPVRAGHVGDVAFSGLKGAGPVTQRARATLLPAMELHYFGM
jgi:hypothetical protein